MSQLSRTDAYHQDIEFRERVKATNRKAARKYYGLTPVSLSERLGDGNTNLLSFGQHRVYLAHNKELPIEGVCFTRTEMARLLGVCRKTFFAWLADGRFPKPVCITYRKWNKTHHVVYSLDHALHLAKVMVEHTSTKAYLSLDDVATIEKLRDFNHYE